MKAVANNAIHQTRAKSACVSKNLLRAGDDKRWLRLMACMPCPCVAQSPQRWVFLNSSIAAVTSGLEAPLMKSSLNLSPLLRFSA